VDISARLTTRFGARVVLLAGLSLILPGLVWFARAPLDATYPTDLLPSMLLLGIGGGLSFPALMTLAMSDATSDDAGLVSGLVSTTAQVGGALGLAVLATLSKSHTDRLLADGESPAAALLGGYHLAFGIGAALVLIGSLRSADWHRLRVRGVPRADRRPRHSNLGKGPPRQRLRLTNRGQADDQMQHLDEPMQATWEQAVLSHTQGNNQDAPSNRDHRESRVNARAEREARLSPQANHQEES
jgi:MFS family permease